MRKRARAVKTVDVAVRREVSYRFGVDTRALGSSNVITPAEIDRVRPADDIASIVVIPGTDALCASGRATASLLSSRTSGPGASAPPAGARV